MCPVYNENCIWKIEVRYSEVSNYDYYGKMTTRDLETAMPLTQLFNRVSTVKYRTHKISFLSVLSFIRIPRRSFPFKIISKKCVNFNEINL
jgi:hypothetical protein